MNLNHPMQSDNMAFLDENSFPGIRRWLKKQKLGEFTGFEACPGSRTYPLYKLY
ncbi:MAG: DUF4313 domain-containing protein [Bacteroidales bacterium]|nr:DUF4313 domain-containing protein [Bacteroidales bacterium]